MIERRSNRERAVALFFFFSSLQREAAAAAFNSPPPVPAPPRNHSLRLGRDPAPLEGHADSLGVFPRREMKSAPSFVGVGKGQTEKTSFLDCALLDFVVSFFFFWRAFFFSFCPFASFNPFLLFSSSEKNNNRQ